MPRRNSFARALADAEKRLNKALAEQNRARIALATLGDEIPALQRTIVALQQHVGQKVVMPNVSNIQSSTDNTGEHRAETSADLLALAGPQDLSGIGSHQPSEDELLPEPEGVELLDK